MPDILAHSPADVLARRLIQTGCVTDPSLNQKWPILVGKEPDLPDNAVTIYNTAGQIDGRSMPTGDVEEHYGVMIRVRSKTQPVGYVRSALIRVKLAKECTLSEITISGQRYLIACASKISQVNDLGEEEESQRNIFTINCLIALTAY